MIQPRTAAVDQRVPPPGFRSLLKSVPASCGLSLNGRLFICQDDITPLRGVIGVKQPVQSSRPPRSESHNRIAPVQCSWCILAFSFGAQRLGVSQIEKTASVTFIRYAITTSVATNSTTFTSTATIAITPRVTAGVERAGRKRRQCLEHSADRRSDRLPIRNSLHPIATGREDDRLRLRRGLRRKSDEWGGGLPARSSSATTTRRFPERRAHAGLALSDSSRRVPSRSTSAGMLR